MKKRLAFCFLFIVFSFNSYAIRLVNALEKFELNELKIYSTTYKNSCGWVAEIVDKNNSIHSLRVGRFIGKNVGKVTKIEENKIYIKEIIQNKAGDWVEQNIIFDTVYNHPKNISN